MNDLIIELKKKNIDFSILANGSIDCEYCLSLSDIECLQKYKVFPYVSNYEPLEYRCYIEK